MTVLSNSVLPLFNLSTEVQLLLSTLAENASTEPKESRDFDASELVHILECHRLGNIFYNRIKHEALFSESVKVQLREIAVDRKFTLLDLSGELCRIVKLFRENEIRSVALKGPTLGMRYFGDYTVRECNDLDILVELENVNPALELLLQEGYQFSDVLWSSPKQKSVYQQTFHHYNLYNPEKEIVVELHWRLYSSAYINKKMRDRTWDNLEVCSLGGFKINVLSRHNLLIYLCLHGGSHRWRRLFWVFDIAIIIKAEGEDFLWEVYQQAVAQGMGRYVLLGCYMAKLLFGTGLPQSINGAIEQDKKIGELAEIAFSSIRDVCKPAHNPLRNVRSFILGIENLKSHYRSAYLLGGLGSLNASIKKFFINPAYWQHFAFSDRYFTFNYVAAPFLWVYSLANKAEE